MIRHSRFAFHLAVLIALAGFLAQPARANASEAAKIHVLIVGDTLGNGAKNFGFDLDIANMKRVVQESMTAQNMENRYTIQVLQGPNVTRGRVLGYYKNLKTSPNDVLLFYFTGHGSIDPVQGQALELRDGRLFKSDLLRAMQQHHPRLTVILNDCCSTIMGNGSLSGPAKYASLPGAVKSVGKVGGPATPAFKTTGSAFRDLMFRHTGVVDIMAASSGQAASGNRRLGGSYFTVALARLLSKDGARFDLNGNGFVEWNEFFTQLRQETIAVSSRGGQPHTPQAVSYGRPVQTGIGPLVLQAVPVPQPPRPQIKPVVDENLPAEGH